MARRNESVLLHFLQLLMQPGRLGGVELASPISNRGYVYIYPLRKPNNHVSNR
jgi:hypothetical protein